MRFRFQMVEFCQWHQYHTVIITSVSLDFHCLHNIHISNAVILLREGGVVSVQVYCKINTKWNRDCSCGYSISVLCLIY